MNSTDRYAFIALLFLVVVVAVAAFWDDGEAAPVHAGGGEGADRRTARVEEPALPEPSRRSRRDVERPVDDGNLDLAGLDDDVAGETPRVSTPAVAGEAHWTRAERRRHDAVERPASVGADGPMTPIPPGGRSGDLAGNGRPGSGASFLPPPPRDDAPASAPGRGTRPPAEPARPRTPANADEPASVAAGGRPGAATDAALREYVVRAGDALSTIASRECGTVSMTKEIARLNGLSDADMIREGMKLKLPPRVASGGTAPVQPTVSPEIDTARADGRPVVTILEGQTLGALLLERFGTISGAMPHVKKLNPDLVPDLVFAGQTIVLPRYDEVEGATRSAAAVASNTSEASSRSRTGNYVR